MAALPFDPSYEHAAPDEAQTLSSIEASMHKIQERTLADGGAPLRSVHAKSHGLLVGELVVEDGLPAELAQGLFARAGRWPVVARLSTTPGDLLPDDVSTPRGMALKVIGVEGERLPGSEDARTQDFALVNGPAFMKKDARGFASSLKLLAATTDRAPGAKAALSTLLRGLEKTIEAVGGQSATLLSLGGHPETHPLGETYYSQVPILFGAYFGKVAMRPVSPALQALQKAPVDLDGRPDGLREAVSDWFAANDGEWELCVQLCTDLDKMPIEDASVVWDESLSPYTAVARVRFSSQSSYDTSRAAAIDAGLAFSPWTGLQAHRPLGSVMRLRQAAYRQARRFREEHAHRTIVEPTSLEQMGLLDDPQSCRTEVPADEYGSRE